MTILKLLKDMSAGTVDLQNSIYLAVDSWKASAFPRPEVSTRFKSDLRTFSIFNSISLEIFTPLASKIFIPLSRKLL